MASIGWQRTSGSADGAGHSAGRRTGGAGASTGPGRTGARHIRTRRELPSRRAALGALLVTTAAVTTFAVANAGDAAPSTRYVVAARALAPGAVLEEGDVTVVALDLPAEQAASALTDASGVAGAVLRGPVAAGALLTTAAVEPPPAADGGALTRFREVSFAVPRARALLGGLVAGDRVDVLVSGEDGTAVLVQRALVLDASSAQGDALLAGDEVVITLALGEGDEALAVAHGAATGELTVLRSTRAADELPSGYPPPARAGAGGAPAFGGATATTVAVGA